MIHQRLKLISLFVLMGFLNSEKVSGCDQLERLYVQQVSIYTNHLNEKFPDKQGKYRETVVIFAKQLLGGLSHSFSKDELSPWIARLAKFFEADPEASAIILKLKNLNEARKD